MNKKALDLSVASKKLKALLSVAKKNLIEGKDTAKNFDRTKPASQHLQELLNKNRITKAAGLSGMRSKARFIINKSDKIVNKSKLKDEVYKGMDTIRERGNKTFQYFRNKKKGLITGSKNFIDKKDAKVQNKFRKLDDIIRL